MGLVILVFFILGVLFIGGLLFADSWQAERVSRVRDQARLRAVEAEMAGLRAALRIQAAEQATRQRMHAEVLRPDFPGRHGTGDHWTV